MASNDDFIINIQKSFLNEAQELLANSEGQILAFEKDPQNAVIIDSILRSIHCLKGSSKSCGLNEISLFTHQIENILIKIKRKEMTTTSTIIDLLLQCNDRLISNINSLNIDINYKIDNQDLVTQIIAFT